MEKFLVNMAVVKVNWDQSQYNILDNYIPLVSYTLQQHENDVLSLEEFKARFRGVAEFDIPTGAIITLLKRAAKKYGLLKKQSDGLYAIERRNLVNSSYATTRDTERRKYNQLKKAFTAYCKEQFSIELDQSDVDEYFFETLYELAPVLFARVSDIENLQKEPSSEKLYLIGQFIVHAEECDQQSFDAIVSFVRGAMLTETFYYSHPSDIPKKMRDVKVFFDTGFLIRALGYCEDVFAEPCRELVELLQSMGVKMRVFRHTYDELHGIFHAAAVQLRTHGRLVSNRPGDVFDFFSRNNSSSSDVELAIAQLDGDLGKTRIQIEEKPEHANDYSVNEKLLTEYLCEEIPNQNEAARNHDIDCLTAVHRLRLGKNQTYLESCIAIFVTTNASLARASTHFFNHEYGSSNVSVCMGDQVFITLVWLKAVNKMPDLPKEQLVASCYAATTPSEALWAKYVKEADKLKDQGNVSEEDYAVLVHSLEARDKLMELTVGQDEILHGTVEQVLASAREKYTEGIAKELAAAKSDIRARSIKLESFANSAAIKIEKIVLWMMISCWVVLLLYGLVLTAPDQWTLESILSLDSIVFVILVFITLLNLIFGVKVIDSCKYVAVRAARYLKIKINKQFLP